MTTFLEFVAEKLMGPAEYGSSWCCPFHPDENPSFFIGSAKPGVKERFKCYGCSAWGDEHDLMKQIDPVKYRDYQERWFILERWGKEFQEREKTQPFSYRGGGSTETLVDPHKLDWAVRDLISMIRCKPSYEDHELIAMRAIGFAGAMFYKHEVPLELVAGKIAEHFLEKKKSLKQAKQRKRKAVKRKKAK